MGYLNIKFYSLKDKEKLLSFSNEFQRSKYVPEGEEVLMSLLQLLRECYVSNIKRALLETDVISHFIQVLYVNHDEPYYNTTFIIEPSDVRRDLILMFVGLMKRLDIINYEANANLAELISWFMEETRKTVRDGE